MWKPESNDEDLERQKPNRLSDLLVKMKVLTPRQNRGLVSYCPDDVCHYKFDRPVATSCGDHRNSNSATSLFFGQRWWKQQMMRLWKACQPSSSSVPD